MPETLYRKYRPQTFADVIGQNHIKLTLQHELVADRISHAYLFTGPRGVGKTTVARILAKAVNCLNRAEDGEPDNTCDACTEIRQGRSLDVLEIDAASHTGVDHVREQIIDNARFSPTRWQYKVFIIDEVHMLSLSAFNALLKTLEEPPRHALFILATTEVHKVPDTIISRCQRFDFRRLRPEDLVERLRLLVQSEHKQVEDAVLTDVARAARGSSRDAESLLGQILTLGDGTITREQAELVLPRTDYSAALDFFDALVRRDAAAAITLVNTLVNEGANIAQFTQTAIELFRKALLLTVSSQLDMFSSVDLTKEEEERLLTIVPSADAAQIERIVSAFVEQEQQLRTAVLPQLPLELAVLRVTVDSATASSIAVLPVEPVPAPAGDGAPAPAELSPDTSAPAKPAKAKKQGQAAIRLEQVQQQWNVLLGALQSRNQSLRLTCNVSVPCQVEGDTIVLGVAYEFHKERIEAPKNRLVIEEVFGEVLGGSVHVRALVTETVPKRISFEREANVETVEAPQTPAAITAEPSAESPAISESTWDALIETFGGKGKG